MCSFAMFFSLCVVLLCLFVLYLVRNENPRSNTSVREQVFWKTQTLDFSSFRFFPNRSLLLRVLISNQRGNRKHTKRQAASTAARPGIAKDARDVAVKPQNQKAKIQKSKKQSQKPNTYKNKQKTNKTCEKNKYLRFSTSPPAPRSHPRDRGPSSWIHFI